MVRALLRGEKTVTRRIAKSEKCQYNKGDLIYVRENFIPYLIPEEKASNSEMKDIFMANTNIPYFIDKSGKYNWVIYPADWINFREAIPNLRCKPSIHIPKTAVRIILEVTNVKRASLMAVTIDDIKSEGIRQYIIEKSKIDPSIDQSLLANWISLWDGINADRGYSWESNPDVWSISFKTHYIKQFRGLLTFSEYELKQLKPYYDDSHFKIESAIFSSNSLGLEKV